MEKFTLSIPYYKRITNNTSWYKISDAKYFIYRINVYIKKYQADDRIRNGEIITVVSSPKDVETTEESSISIKSSEINVHKTIADFVSENELITSACSDIEAKIGTIIPLNLSADLKSGLTSRIKKINSLSNQYEVSYINEHEYTRKITRTYGPQIHQKTYLVKPFKRMRYDVYFSFIDYLFVSYKNALGLKKRKKDPDVENNRHINKIVLKMPAFSFVAWEQVDNSIWEIPESEYKNEVIDQSKIEIEPIKDTSDCYIPIPEYSYDNIPTLYQIANSAFPLKWQKKSSDWTKEDLRKLDEKEGNKQAAFTLFYRYIDRTLPGNNKTRRNRRKS